MNIIGTGLSGLVGSRICELMPHVQFEDISRKTGTDITNKSAVVKRIEQSTADIVLHLAAFTNVDGAETEKDLGRESQAWKINVIGTRNVVSACEQLGKKLIYFSTDMVFSGNQDEYASYTEEDAPDPKNWYATTKYEAENVIRASSISSTILRIAYPYRANFEKKEYVRVFLSLLQQQKPFSAISDHFFTPTFIDDIAGMLEYIFQHTTQGIFHLTPGQKISPYLGALAIAKEFGLDAKFLSPTTREAYFQNKAHRGFNLSLNNAKIKALGIQLKSFTEGLHEIKTQLT